MYLVNFLSCPGEGQDSFHLIAFDYATSLLENSLQVSGLMCFQTPKMWFVVH